MMNTTVKNINTTVTIADRVFFTKFGLKEKSISDVIQIIRTGDLLLSDSQTGNYTLKDISVHIRSQIDPKIQNELKERFLPVVTFNGVWDGEKICKYSNITALDFDYISNDNQLTKTLLLLKSLPFVYAIFRTFKPYRIKALVLHDNSDPLSHKEMYEQFIDIFRAYGIDKSGKDLSRRTYLAWDKDIWVNLQCVPYHFNSSAPQNTQVKIQSTFPGPVKTNVGKAKSPASIINILNSSWRQKHPEYWLEGNRANSVFKCACQFCEYGVPQDMATEYFLNGGWLSDDFSESEILKNVYGAYKFKMDNYGSKSFI